MGSKKPFMDLLKELGVERSVWKTPTTYEEFIELLHTAEADEASRRMILSTAEQYWRNYQNVHVKYGDYMSKLAEEVRKIKEYSIDHIEELIKITRENIEKNGGFFHYAEKAEDACKIIGELVGSGKLIVKSKSITSEEIHLREYLEELGNEVYETDVGEFLVQALGPRPMHLTSPALHIPKERVAKFLEKLTGKSVDPNNIEAMVGLIREFLRDKYIRADVGISGANVIAADPGYVFIIENENNARLSTGLPYKHIVIAGIEKIVPTYLDAVKVVDVITKYAGYRALSYIDVIGGPSKTGDIEKKVTLGAQGPKEFHLVLLDNGRLKAAKDPVFKEALYCLRCGACMYVCPVFRLLAGYWGGDTYMGGIGIIWEAITRGLESAYNQALLCLGDMGCTEICPMKIDQAKLIKEIIRRVNNKYLPNL